MVDEKKGKLYPNIVDMPPMIDDDELDERFEELVERQTAVAKQIEGLLNQGFDLSPQVETAICELARLLYADNDKRRRAWQAHRRPEGDHDHE